MNQDQINSTWIHAIKAATLKSENFSMADKKIIDIRNQYGEFEDYFSISKAPLDLEQAHQELEACREQGIQTTNYFAADYPAALRELQDAPAILYYYGDLGQFNYQENISIVGTRHASLYGKHSTRALVQALANYKCRVVSGLAYGIDYEAHATALENKIPNIAVLGSGLLKVSLDGKRNKLFHSLKNDPSNLIISEFLPKQDAMPYHFPLRNRIIAALSRITIVIEARIKSGSLITASRALELGKEVLTLPGDLNKDSFKGSNQLLASGQAQPIYSISQIHNFLGLSKRQKTSQNNINHGILEALDSGPLSFDNLMQKLNMNKISLSTQLSLLEIQGHIKKENGMKFVRS